LTGLFWWTNVIAVKGVILLIVGGIAVDVMTKVVGIVHAGVVTAWDFSRRFIDNRKRKRRKFSGCRVAFMGFWIFGIFNDGRIVPVTKEVGEGEDWRRRLRHWALIATYRPAGARVVRRSNVKAIHLVIAVHRKLEAVTRTLFGAEWSLREEVV